MSGRRVSRSSSARLAASNCDSLGLDTVLHVEFAPEGSRAREVKTRSKQRASGAIPSFRMSRMIHWESTGERCAIKILDADASVLYLAEQPCVVRYRMGGAVHRHYPDLLVRRKATQTLVEIKTRADALSPEVARRTALMHRELPRFGYAYQVLIAEDLERQPRMKNVEFVLRHGRRDLTVTEREELRRFMVRRTSVPWVDVLDGRAGPLTISRACRLILEGRILLDFEKPWTHGAIHVRIAELSGTSNAHGLE